MKNAHVLYVEDDPVNAMLMQGILELRNLQWPISKAHKYRLDSTKFFLLFRVLYI